jgi:hypothetical protein
MSTYQFPFEQSVVTISVPVNRSVFEGARQADKEVTIFGNISENVWMADSYRALAGDHAQDELYNSLATEFRSVKEKMGLSDDEYVELLTSYAQSLRYETITENPAKFPVETVVDASGDCDDKSLLLAGLLSHEGFRVALLSFGPEAHMAIGVGSVDYRYKNTNYTFIEATNFSYVGVPTTTLENGVILRSDPVIIPFGEGLKTYTLGQETRFISDTGILAEKRAKELERQLLEIEPDLKAQWDRIAQIEQQMTGMRASGNIRGYNELVSEHNALVSGYNTQLDTYRQIRDRYEQYAGVYNYIISHEYDRKGVSEYIRKNLPA